MRSVPVTTAFLSGVLAAVGALASGDAPLAPIPDTILLDGKPLDDRKIDLGHRLFFDKRLSKDGSMSCVSCHVMNERGAGASPHVAKDKNVAGNPIATNSPSVFNVPLSFRFAWDGEATLHDVINRPMTNHMNVPPEKDKPRKKGSDEQKAAEAKAWQHVADVVNDAKNGYVADFATIYGPRAAVRADVEDAIANYVMALAPRHSRFDEYLSGHDDAIGPEAKEGYKRFKELGCVSCHQGRGVGGNMVAELGVMFADDADLQSAAAPGIIEKDPATGHLKRYRVPSLRNVMRTAPYFHDGSAATIEEAVTDMGQWQLGRELSKDDVRLIVAFLETLNGTPDAKLLADPFDAGVAR